MKIVIRMILTLTIIGVVAGGFLANVAQWANPLIEANKKAETEKAIFLVQPDGKSYQQIKNTNFEIYKVFGENNELVGYSIAHEGNGFQGKIRLMVGVSSDLNKIKQLEILDQVETPGLGTLILEPPFRKQFSDLSTDPKVNLVKGVEPSKPNEIQSITGATISSKAVVEIINKGIEKARILKERGAL